MLYVVKNFIVVIDDDNDYFNEAHFMFPTLLGISRKNHKPAYHAKEDPLRS